MEYLILVTTITVFSLVAIWIRAVITVWSGSFSWRFFLSENYHRFILCAIGNLIFSAAIFLAPEGVDTILGYLGFGWIGGAAGAGFVSGFLCVLATNAEKHPLRQ